jgi:hypothetical protein
MWVYGGHGRLKEVLTSLMIFFFHYWGLNPGSVAC